MCRNAETWQGQLSGETPLHTAIMDRESVQWRERERCLGSTCCTLLSSSNLVLLLFRCPHGTVLQEMVGVHRMAVGVDVDVPAGCGDPRCAPRIECFCQKCTTGMCGVERTADTVRVSPTRLRSRRRPRLLAGMGSEELVLAGRRSLERELGPRQKKLSGPKNTAKVIEAKQNWINRETKGIEAEVEKLAEMQETNKARKETLRVAYEEIKKLRTDLVQDGESMDKDKSHVLCPESLEEVRDLELHELCLRWATAPTRMAGASRDATTEDIASWFREACHFQSGKVLLNRSVAGLSEGATDRMTL